MIQSGVTVAVALDQEPFSTTGWSVSSAYRHRQRHLSATVLREVRANPDLGAADIIDVLAATLADVQAVRAAALAAGSSGLVLRTADATIRAAGALADRLGLDPAEIAREIRDAETLSKAVSLAIRDHPESAEWIAEHLQRYSSDEEFATEIRELGQKAVLRLEAMK